MRLHLAEVWTYSRPQNSASLKKHINRRMLLGSVMTKRWHLSEQFNEGLRVLRNTNDVLLSLSLVKLKQEGEPVIYKEDEIHKGLEDGAKLVRSLQHLVRAIGEGSGEVEAYPGRALVLAVRLIDSYLGDFDVLLSDLEVTLKTLECSLAGSSADIDQAWRVISGVHILAQDQIESSRESVVLA